MVPNFQSSRALIASTRVDVHVLQIRASNSKTKCRSLDAECNKNQLAQAKSERELGICAKIGLGGPPFHGRGQ
eukprot:SAG31_NODE_268_length_18767_cov_4.644900_3_plen_73_part_00